MSITDELREYTEKQIKWLDMTKVHYRKLLAIADRIDAEHEAQLNDAFETRNSDENLESDGWIRLPKDADGEYIHIGDEMEYGKSRGHVIALMLSNYPKKWGGGLHWGIQLEGEHAPTALDGLFRHYHAPTVEDVLREFGDKYCDVSLGSDAESELFAEYAAKLRELLQRTWDAFHDATAREFVTVKNELRELGVEVDG